MRTGEDVFDFEDVKNVHIEAENELVELELRVHRQEQQMVALRGRLLGDDVGLLSWSAD